jgi:hypothetical protein
VPSYVRTELKKKTGIVVDEYGKKIQDEEENDNNQKINNMFNIKESKVTVKGNTQKEKKSFTPIQSYKPQGNLVYNDELLNTLEEKIT